MNGDLDLSICAIIHDVHRLCCRLALCLCFAAGVCTIGKLSQRAATTGREGHDCANSDDSWLHIDVIHKHGRRGQAVKRERFLVIRFVVSLDVKNYMSYVSSRVVVHHGAVGAGAE